MLYFGIEKIIISEFCKTRLDWFCISHFYYLKELIMNSNSCKTIQKFMIDNCDKLERVIIGENCCVNMANNIDEWKRMAIEAYTNDVKIKSGVKEYLDYLKEKGVKMAIATASDMNLVEPVLKSNGIYDYFQNITTAKEVRRGKGFPDIYDVAAHKMGIEPEKCIVFEDILQGIKGAIAGNYTAIAVYDKASDNDREEIKRLAYRYIADFREMIN